VRPADSVVSQETKSEAWINNQSRPYAICYSYSGVAYHSRWQSRSALLL